MIDRETTLQVDRGADVEEQFHCVDCGRTFDEKPDPETLREVPCDPRHSGEGL